ncbi:ribosomal protein S18-alanine N-acetyltransferase [Dactylosporangium sp. CS-047395]|uniref:ribosomal protein S18-alanine N-acetyltransferase n=1 Tax=Dactylosporangium sp. CS-047395 TaxID=3239936 RepID=UPI003D8E8690
MARGIPRLDDSTGTGRPAPAGALLFDTMRRRDVPAVSAIERVSFPTPFTPRVYRAVLADPTARWWVARFVDRSAIAGYVGYFLAPDNRAHLAKIAVAPAWRGRHVGDRLLRHTLTAAGREGAELVTLEVRVTNTAALALYRKWGFVELYRSPGHYPDTGEDGLILARLP